MEIAFVNAKNTYNATFLIENLLFALAVGRERILLLFRLKSGI